MRQRYVIWTSHFLVIGLLAIGLWWLKAHMPGMPDYKLMVGLVSATGLVLNHLRWLKIAREISGSDLIGKIGFLTVANYTIMLLALMLSDFRG